MIKRVVILQDEQLVVREIQRNMQRAAAAPAAAAAAAAAAVGRRRSGGRRWRAADGVRSPPRRCPTHRIEADEPEPSRRTRTAARSPRSQRRRR